MCTFDVFLSFLAALALTVENIMTALKGIEKEWYYLGDCLYVPKGVIDELWTQHSTDFDRLRTMLQYVLTLHPYASWRSIIRALHVMKEHRVANKILEYAEPVTGTMYMYTTSTVLLFVLSV